MLFTKLIAIDIDPVGKDIKAGVKKYKLGDFNGSLEHFRKAEKEISGDPRLEFNKATTYYKMGEYSQALESFEKALQTNDLNLKAKAMYNLGNTYYKIGNKKKAIESYTRALNIDPNFTQAKQNLEIIRKEEKGYGYNTQKNENEEKSQSQSSNSETQLSSQNQKKENSLLKQKELEEQKKLTQEEANRILESYKQDTVKRKKTSSPWSSYNEIFW